jgi:hypothetical protein
MKSGSPALQHAINSLSPLRGEGPEERVRGTHGGVKFA